MHKMIWFQGKSILYPDLSYIQLSYKQSVLYMPTFTELAQFSYIKVFNVKLASPLGPARNSLLRRIFIQSGRLAKPGLGPRFPSHFLSFERVGRRRKWTESSVAAAAMDEGEGGFLCM